MQNNTKPSLEEIHQAIIVRDKKDAEIDKKNRSKLVKNGLKIIQPKKIIKINTGEVIGVPNVVNLIKKEVVLDDRIISVEGESGCGKSSTAEALSEVIGAILFSMGELFRYLTYVRLSDQNFEIEEELNSLEYRMVEEKLCLHKGSQNITNELKTELHSHKIDLEVANTASQSQLEVIRYMSVSIPNLANQSQKKIVLEGRAFTLDFLPSDLRIILFADVEVRAERRMKQER
jgi:cytidylate kinase